MTVMLCPINMAEGGASELAETALQDTEHDRDAMSY